MPKKTKKKIPPSQWKIKTRKINGKNRRVRVRRIKGKEQVRVLSPKNKKK